MSSNSPHNPSDPSTHPHAIQSIPPSQVITTSDIPAYQAAIATALHNNQPIADYGQTHQSLGNPPPPKHLQILPPTGVINHYVADMTVTVAAGTTLADLQTQLATQNQTLPIDAAAPHTTIAELIAHNISGPLRLTHGSTRDLLLGLAFIDGHAKLITVGGRTVKNVAGYDVTRLLVGSLNTLGLITQATLKTIAIPKQITTAAIPIANPAELDARITSLLTSNAAPAYLDLQTQITNSEATHTLHVGYADTPAACDAHFDSLITWLKQSNLKYQPPTRINHSFADDEQARATRRDWRQQHTAVVKLIVRPAHTGQLLNQLTSLPTPPAIIDALPSLGLIHIGANYNPQQALDTDSAINKILDPHNGMRIWLNRPDNIPAIQPFAPAQPDWPLLAELKKTFDPKNIFNPNRMSL